jgi:hypothetical protein
LRCVTTDAYKGEGKTDDKDAAEHPVHNAEEEPERMRYTASRPLDPLMY